MCTLTLNVQNNLINNVILDKYLGKIISLDEGFISIDTISILDIIH